MGGFVVHTPILSVSNKSLLLCGSCMAMQFTHILPVFQRPVG